MKLAFASLLALVIGLIVGALLSEDCVASPPRAALAHQRDLTREARAVFGLRAPIAVFAAQVHQESAWRDDARSPVGAEGLAQFMPATSRWMTELYPAALGDTAQPWNPRWALRAMVRYDRWLLARVKGRTACDEWWAALRSYNGGLGHWRAEARFSADPEERRCVDAQCGKARRHPSHCRENLHYPKQVLERHQWLYAGWGRTVYCGTVP